MITHTGITNTEFYLIYTMINYDIMLIGTQFRVIAQNNATVHVRTDPICGIKPTYGSADTELYNQKFVKSSGFS